MTSAAPALPHRVVRRFCPFKGMDRAAAVTHDRIDEIEIVLGVKFEPFSGPTFCQHHLGEVLIRIGQPCHDNGFEAEQAERALQSVHCRRHLVVAVQSFDEIKRLPAIVYAGHRSPTPICCRGACTILFLAFLAWLKGSLLMVVCSSSNDHRYFQWKISGHAHAKPRGPLLLNGVHGHFA